MDFGDEQKVPAGGEGKGKGSIAERVLDPIFAGSAVAIDGVGVNQAGADFGDVEERSGVVEMDFRRDRTDRWNRGERGAQRAGGIRDPIECHVKIVEVKPG